MKILQNVWSFFVVLLFIILGFTLIFYHLQIAECVIEDLGYPISRNSFFCTLLIVYNVLYSQFDFAQMGGPNNDALNQIFMVFMAFMLGVVLLNLLVAIMGDSYAEIRENDIPSDNYERLELALEVLQTEATVRRIAKAMFSCCLKQLGSKKRRFIEISKQKHRNGYLMFAYLASEFEENSKMATEGRIKALRKEVISYQNKMKHYFEKLDEREVKFQQDLRTELLEIKEKLRSHQEISQVNHRLKQIEIALDELRSMPRRKTVKNDRKGGRFTYHTGDVTNFFFPILTLL